MRFCEKDLAVVRKHTSAQLPGVLLCSINHIGWRYFEQIDTNSVYLGEIREFKTAMEENNMQTQRTSAFGIT